MVIGRCLDALAEMAPSAAVVVIDNASQDLTLDEVRARGAVRVVANAKNRGFAAAVNQGVKSVDAEYYLLLNPDVYLRTNLDPLLEASSDHGLAAGKLTDQTGMVQRGFTIRRFPRPLTLWFELCGLNRIWPSNPVNRRYRYLDREMASSGSVEQPAGAFLMFRKDVWEKLGGFDEGFYPIWFEDVDFCLRANQLGYKPYFEPKVAAEHEGGHSILRIGRGCRARLWCASLLRYAAKHFPSGAYRGICAAVLLTSVPRAVAGMIQERSLSPILSCINIVWFAGGRLVAGPGGRADLGRFS
jgi:N-acetylglucosaminyl-diphospho-decaprenol L-rhamnosyltransferase